MNVAQPTPRPSPGARRLLWLVGLALLLLAAAWLRWRYLTTISLYVDEFTSLWAARQVQAHGAPVMPSGVLYTRGLLASYVEALFLTLFGFSYTVGRLPSLLFGLGTILVVFLCGRRAWRPSVGWLAALGLTLLPEAIIWSARARFYAQLQFFSLLAVWAAWAVMQEYATSNTELGIRAQGAPAEHGSRNTRPTEPHTQRDQSKIQNPFWLFPLFFVLALFSQEETILLYPAIVLAGWWWHGWRYFLQREVAVGHLVCVLAIGVRLAIEILGQPGYFETIQSERPYVGWVFDLRGAWTVYGPLLVGPERILWTVAGLWALLSAGLALRRVGWRPAALTRWDGATLFFALHFWTVLAIIFGFVGTSWREARYLFLVQPFWLLVGVAGLVRIGEQLAAWLPVGQRRLLARVHPSILIGVLGILIAGLMTPAAAGVYRQQVEGYDRALAYLAGVRQAGEPVLSPQPPACALVLARCDYYALQRGYEEFVIQRDGVLVDRWTGSPLLDTVEQLAEVVGRGGPTWFVTDSFRLATRYEDDFVRTVVEQFDLAAQEGGVMVLRAEGWRPAAASAVQTVLSPTLRFGPLALTGWERGAPAAGADLPVTLFWQAAAPISQQFNTSLRLVNRAGQTVDQDDGPPARGLIPTNLFFAAPRPDPKTLTLPADLPLDRYRLDVAAYDVTTHAPAGEPQPIGWLTLGPPPPPPATPLDVRWQNGLRLVGTDPFSTTVRAGDELTLRLVWATDEPLNQDYTAFVHLVGADPQPVAQDDHAAEGGFYPTSAWAVGELVADGYRLTLPASLAPGDYQVVVGLYQPEQNQRLSLENGNDAYPLAKVTVTDAAP